MKISTKGRYGLRALLDMAVHAGDGSVTLANVAARQEISVGYLEQIFSALRKAGIVIGTKGPQGGYVLAKSPDRLTVKEALDALEGDLFTVNDDSVVSQEASLMQRAIRAAVWDKIAEAAAGALAGLTLAEIAEAYEHNRAGGDYIYYI